MKKIKVLFVVTLLLLCLGITTTTYAKNSEVNFVKIQSNSELEFPTSCVLEKGYYVFASASNQFTEDNFKGDLNYCFFSSSPIFTAHDFKENLGLDLEETVFDEMLTTPFIKDFSQGEIDTYGVYFVRVFSYGAFTTKEYTEHIIGYGLTITSPNTNQNVAGGKTHVVSVDHPITKEQLKQRYTASDNAAGTITGQLYFETNYDPDHLKIGTYYIYVSVEDNAHNKTHAVDIVSVRDFIPPQLFLSEACHEVKVFETFTSQDAYKLFSATDNYLNPEEIAIYYTDTYKNCYTQVGEYFITAHAEDYEGNTSESLTLKIRVIDDIAPILSLEAGGNLIQSNYELSDAEIKQLIQITDNYYTLSKEDIEIVSNTCTGEQGREYQITARIKDGSGNIGQSTFRYYLNDTTYPIITVEQTLYLPINVYYSTAQILEMLKEAGIIDKDAINVEIVSSIDFENQQEGIHSISYIETLADGTQRKGSTDLTFFSPVNSTKEESIAQPIQSWYYVLFILPVFLSIVYFIIKNIYEKD